MIEDESTSRRSTQSDGLLPQRDGSPASADNRPRLSIFHFLVWTALSAGNLAFFSLVLGRFNENSPLEKVRITLFAVVAAANFGGLLMWAVLSRRGISFPRLPGEWLLAMQGIRDLFRFASFAAIYFSWNPEDDPPERFVAYVNLFLEFANLAVFLAPAIFCRTTRIWRWFFRLASLVAGCVVVQEAMSTFAPQSLASTFRWNYFAFDAVCASVFVVAIVFDIRHRRQANWLSWLGIVALVCEAMDTIAWALQTRFGW